MNGDPFFMQSDPKKESLAKKPWREYVGMRAGPRPARVSNILDGGVYVSTPNMPPRPISRCQAITDIIESIAQEQAAVGRIMSAEADKLEKLICMCTHPQELIKANQSVNQLVESVHHLEMVLQAKLALFMDCLCPCPCPPYHKDKDEEAE